MIKINMELCVTKESKKEGINLHRLVLVLYKIRNPHCRQRTGSSFFITFFAPQSPQRYSTPLIAVLIVADGVAFAARLTASMMM